jgi:hypothetical protein
MSGFFIFNYKNKASANYSSVVDYNIGKKRMRVGSNINLGKDKRAFVMVEEKKILKIGYVGLVGNKTPGEQPWFSEGGKEWNNVYQIEECSELVVLEQLCSELEIDKKIFTKSLQFGHVRAEFKDDFERAVTYFQGRVRPDPEQKYEEQDQPPEYDSEQPGESINMPAPPVLRREVASDYPAPMDDQVEEVLNRFVLKLTDGLVKNLAKEMVDEQEKRESEENQRQMEREAKEREEKQTQMKREKQRQIDREEKQREAKEEFKCKVEYCYACKLEHISAAKPSYEGVVCDYAVCKRVVNARHERIADVEAAYQFKKYHNVSIEQHQNEVLAVLSSRQKPKDKFPYPIIKNPFFGTTQQEIPITGKSAMTKVDE